MKSFKKFLSNKLFIAIACIVVAGIIAFIIVPSDKKADAEMVNVVKVNKTITENTKITDSMIKVESMSKGMVPDNVISDKRDVVGKYAKVNLYTVDFITPEKLSDIDTESSLYALKSGERAVSVTPKTLARSVSGNLLIGDVVQLYGYDTETNEISEDSGKWYFEVLAIDNSKSENVSGLNSDESSDIVPSAITVKAISEEQVESIVRMENSTDIQIVFAGRGEVADTLLGRTAD